MTKNNIAILNPIIILFPATILEEFRITSGLGGRVIFSIICNIAILLRVSHPITNIQLLTMPIGIDEFVKRMKK